MGFFCLCMLPPLQCFRAGGDAGPSQCFRVIRTGGLQTVYMQPCALKTGASKEHWGEASWLAHCGHAWSQAGGIWCSRGEGVACHGLRQSRRWPCVQGTLQASTACCHQDWEEQEASKRVHNRLVDWLLESLATPSCSTGRVSTKVTPMETVWERSQWQWLPPSPGHPFTKTPINKQSTLIYTQMTRILWHHSRCLHPFLAYGLLS